MPRPYTDIKAIDPTKPINNKTAICSTTVTGYSTKRVIRSNFPGNLTISNVEQKFGNRFYNGIFVNVINGDLDGGNSLN
jgi:hypothetical protein